jgi:ABC-type uncharacterized transport system permease subunit
LDAAIRLLNTLLPIVYGLTVLAYLADFVREDPLAARVGRGLLVAAVSLHAGYLALRTAAYAHVPLASLFEVLTSVAFGLAVVYLYVEARSGVATTGAFVIAFVFAFQTVSSAFVSAPESFPPVLRSPLFALHTATAVLGHTAFAVSAVYGVLFLLLHHELKASRFGIVYRRLPPLDVLARMSLRAWSLGLAFLSATIAIGALWAAGRYPAFVRDPKVLLTFAVWMVYAGGLWLHYRRGWPGRRTMYVSLVGFALMVVSMAAVRLFLPSFHWFA